MRKNVEIEVRMRKIWTVLVGLDITNIDTESNINDLMRIYKYCIYFLNRNLKFEIILMF